MKKVYICSAYHGGYEQNAVTARQYFRDAVELGDTIPAERTESMKSEIFIAKCWGIPVKWLI